MNFSDALYMLKNRKVMAREGWLSPNAIALHECTDTGPDDTFGEAIFALCRDTYTAKYVCWSWVREDDTDEKAPIVEWTPSSFDLLADDWVEQEMNRGLR